MISFSSFCIRNPLLIFLINASLNSAYGFTIRTLAPPSRSNDVSKTTRLNSKLMVRIDGTADENFNVGDRSVNNSINSRRDFFSRTGMVVSGVATTTSSSLLFIPSKPAIAAVPPIGIIGASGRTGSLCVLSCIRRGLPVRVLTRSGTWEAPELIGSSDAVVDITNNELLTIKACDVKDRYALEDSLSGCRGVIYAASASKKGGDAKAIDNIGVVTAGDVCLDKQIQRYIVISSTATTRPNSLGYKFTNIIGNIMAEKREGEIGVQDAYKNRASSSSSSSSYTIIRPGGLEEPKKNEILGPGELEISQGDALAGIVSRADLAEVAVELALRDNERNIQNTAIELYYTSSAQPCERQFKSLLTTTTDNDVVRRLHGETYSSLFEGIQPNIDYYVP